MIARIFDPSKKEYYISEVYGIINCGINKYIVDKFENKRENLILVDYFDCSKQPLYDIWVERISANPVLFPWIYVPREEMKNFNKQIKSDNEYHYFSGYKLIWERPKQLMKLLMNGSILKKDLIQEEITSKLEGWNYIESKDDIDKLMKQFSGFHDSVIRELHYISGDYKLPDGSMHLTESCQKNLRMIFDSDWSESIEMIFEAPRILQLVPPCENYLADLYDVSIFIKNCMVYFYDSYMEYIPDVYEGTFIKAMAVRWRKI